MADTSNRHRINCSATPTEYARLTAAAKAAGMSVPAFVVDAALRAAGRQTSVPAEDVRRILVAVRQAADGLQQIGAQASRTLKVGVFDAIKAKRRLHEIEKALLPLFAPHGN
jgi:uncharacterized protein (DUF1778 family)